MARLCRHPDIQQQPLVAHGQGTIARNRATWQSRSPDMASSDRERQHVEVYGRNARFVSGIGEDDFAVKKEIRIGGLDGLRAAAIVSVLCLHAAIVVTRMPLIFRVPCLYGWAGVDLFFVLSGYLIGGQAFKAGGCMDGGGIVRFWLRRWFRTLPLYYFILFVNVIILPQCGIPFRDWNW